MKPDIFFQSLPGENSAFAVYHLCSIVYVCDSIGISGLRCAIFRSVSEITCGWILHKMYFKIRFGS